MFFLQCVDFFFFFKLPPEGAIYHLNVAFHTLNVALFTQPTAKGLIWSLFFTFNIFEIQTDIYWQHFSLTEIIKCLLTKNV